MQAMSNALFQLLEVEKKFTEIDKTPFIDIQLEKKHIQLMEISDWATSLKKQNEQMRHEFKELTDSRLYRLFRFFQKRGI